MKARSIVLTIAVATLTFILGGFLVYQVVSPKENKEEEQLQKENAKEEKGTINNLITYPNGIFTINGKPVIDPCSLAEGLDIEYLDYGNFVAVYNKYVIFDYSCSWGTSSNMTAIYDENAEMIYDLGGYVEYTSTGIIKGVTIKDSEGNSYWEETIIDLTGDKPNIKTTKEKINVDCKIYGGDNYETLSEKDKVKYYECCNDCI